MPNKQFFLSFENFEKGLIVLYVRDLPAVKVGGGLALEGAVGRLAVVLTPETEEALPLDGVVLPVVVEVHLDIGGADVDLENIFGLQKIFLSDRKYF